MSLSPSVPVRCLLLSAMVAVSGAAALSGLAPLSSTPSVPAPQIPIAAPAPAAPVAADTVRARAVTSTVLPPAVEQVLRDGSAAGLDCATTAQGVPLCVHGEDLEPSDPRYVEGSTSGSTGTAGTIGCYGDGTSGPRVRAVYARPQSAPDRYAASVSSIRSWAAGVSRQFDTSAKATGGRRHVRFATTAGSSCTVTVLNVVLPDAAFGSFRATIDALEARGFDAPASKYLVWADAAGYCGIATSYADDRPGADNLNNGRLPAYARVDRKCWGKVETHEVVHMLGGVQPSARNATKGFHCSDGLDVMCYDDGTAGSTQRAVCGKERVHLLDCRNDDYFSTSAPVGSYLQTHWNTARSSFLAATLTEAAPAPAPAPAETTSPTRPSPSPSPSSSSGSLTDVDLDPVREILPTLAPVVPALLSTVAS